MSTPDTEKWKATGAEIWDISGADANETQRIIATVARRRALEELRALYLAICPGCANGMACYHSHSISTCPTQKIQNRIAEIEAEGE